MPRLIGHLEDRGAARRAAGQEASSQRVTSKLLGIESGPLGVRLHDVGNAAVGQPRCLYAPALGDRPEYGPSGDTGSHVFRAATGQAIVPSGTPRPAVVPFGALAGAEARRSSEGLAYARELTRHPLGERINRGCPSRSTIRLTSCGCHAPPRSGSAAMPRIEITVAPYGNFTRQTAGATVQTAAAGMTGAGPLAKEPRAGRPVSRRRPFAHQAAIFASFRSRVSNPSVKLP